MKLKSLIIVGLLLVAAFIAGCAQGPSGGNTDAGQNAPSQAKQIRLIEVEIYPEGKYAEIEVHFDSGIEEFDLQTANRDLIVQQLAAKYGKTASEINSVIEFEVEEEEEDEDEEAGETEMGGMSGTGTIEITSSGFSPATLTVKAGDTVTFINKDNAPHWPASAVHPTHQVYPESGGCIGSKFDACRGLSKGESWSFTFNQKGSWGYHDHLAPSLRGKIDVE